MSRPLTHDLLKSVFSTFNAKILRIEIIALKDDIFYGNIVADADQKIIDIDARPSDAIALAVRAHVPILVGQDVMDAAGIVPEKDMQSDVPPAPAAHAEDAKPQTPPARNNEEGLDVFEDFLKKLKDDPDEPDEQDNQEEDPKL
jgi:hypothetical protein